MEIPGYLHPQIQQLLSIETENALIQGSWFILLEPKLFRDGNEWCALYGENIEEGVCGFGKSPSKAVQEFNKAWEKELPDSTKEFCE